VLCFIIISYTLANLNVYFSIGVQNCENRKEALYYVQIYDKINLVVRGETHFNPFTGAFSAFTI
jgi:hypothetical protein